jgi:hypothetical protein
LFDRGGSAFHESERYHGVAFLAETARQAGCVEAARSIVAELSQQALTSPAPTLLVHLDYPHAVLASDNNAEQLFIEALFRNLERWPWHRARVQLAYGSWLRRQRRPADARAPLRFAHASLELIGAPIWATQAAADLSPRTVGSHLYRIFPKLGISSRGQLAARLGDAASSISGPHS